ncbi:hypothetical protein CR513_39175, partial [Mucuna pruriens]
MQACLSRLEFKLKGITISTELETNMDSNSSKYSIITELKKRVNFDYWNRKIQLWRSEQNQQPTRLLCTCVLSKRSIPQTFIIELYLKDKESCFGNYKASNAF